MPHYTSLAILGGTGNLGTEILAALTLHPRYNELDIRVLTRKYIDLPGASVHEIDYNYPSADSMLAEALQGVEVLISAVGDDSGLRAADVPHTGHLPGYIAQERAARVAKNVGVKLFVPSEYGYPTHTLPLEPMHFITGKRLFLDVLRNELELPHLLLYTGSFPKEEPPRTSLPPCTSDTPASSPPHETTRFHVAAYLIRLVLDRGTPGIYRILNLKRDKLVVEEGKELWVLDEGDGLEILDGDACLTGDLSC